MPKEHAFDRRSTDANVSALGTRLHGIEDTVIEKVLPRLEENTRICTQLHEAVFGKGDDDGLMMKVQEMHDVFSRATNGIRVLSVMGNGIVKGIEIAGKVAKPLIYVAILVGAIIGFIKTGTWDLKP
jgi:hypothetical protein